MRKVYSNMVIAHVSDVLYNVKTLGDGDIGILCS